MHEITMNGKKYPLENSKTLKEVLDEFGITPSQMAIELNGEIIPHNKIEQNIIEADDRIEIIQFVGGG